jgi:uncharacterized phiE125 gp8 family phage protein
MEMSHRTVAILGPEPVTLAEAKVQLRYEQSFTARDELIETQITAAREFCEQTLDKAIVEQRIEFAIDAFPSARSIELPMTALVEVEEVSYLQNGLPSVLPAFEYLADDFSTPGAVFLRTGKRWPTGVDRERNAVRITYIAGQRLETGQDYRSTIKQAVLMLVAHYDMNPQAVVTGTIATEVQLGVERLLQLSRRLGM